MIVPFYFRKPAVYLHQDCAHFNTEESKCTLKGCIVKKSELSCKQRDLINPEKRDKFECKHCQSPKWDPYMEQTIWRKIGNDDVQIAFYHCAECGNYTAVCAKDYQRVWAVPTEEDYEDTHWSGLKILENV